MSRSTAQKRYFAEKPDNMARVGVRVRFWVRIRAMVGIRTFFFIKVIVCFIAVLRNVIDPNELSQF